MDAYVDQMVWGTAARARDWSRDHVLGRIAPLVRSGAVTLRPSLAHDTETLLDVDVDLAAGCTLRSSERLDRRQKVARLMLELCDFGRPVHRSEVLAVEELLAMVRRAAPSAVRETDLAALFEADRRELHTRFTLLAENRELHDASEYERLRKQKVLNQLAQMRLRDADYLRVFFEGEKRAVTPYDELERMPLPDVLSLVEAEIERLRLVDARDLPARWQRRRDEVEREHACNAIIEALDYFRQTFGIDPPGLDTRELAARWAAIEERLGPIRLWAPLPDLAAARAAGWDHARCVTHLVQPLVERLHSDHMPSTRIMIYGATLQVERGMVDLEARAKRRQRVHELTVTPSNAIDCERLVAINHVDVFFTTDAALALAARRAKKRYGIERVTICDSADAFEQAVRTRTK